MSFKPNLSNGTGKFFRKQLDTITRQKSADTKVISLSDYRSNKNIKQKKTVLVVDDDEIMRNALKRVLEGENFNVLAAEDGYALSHLLDASFLDMILLDITLPWVDGFELVQLLKSHSVLKEIPVIMVSAHKSTDDIRRAMELGANDFIGKPFDVDYLVQAIRKNLPSAG